MSSSFKRASSATAAPSGTRRWVDGQCLVSTGHASLDAALGGGVPLGSLVLLEDDASGNGHGALLASIFAAEGLACGHALTVAGGDGRLTLQQFVENLPLCVSRGSADLEALATGQGASVAKSSQTSELTEDTAMGMKETPVVKEDGPSEEEGEEQCWDVNGSGLHNAWQYKKYLPGAADGTDNSKSSSLNPNVPPVSSSSAQKYCHTFDLGRRIPAVSLSAAAIELVPTEGVFRVPMGCSELVARAQIVAACVAGGGGKPPPLRAGSRGCAAEISPDLSVGYRKRDEDRQTLSSAAALLSRGLSPNSHSLFEAFTGRLTSSMTSPPPHPSPVRRIVVLGFGGPGWPGCSGIDTFSAPSGAPGGKWSPPAPLNSHHLGLLRAVTLLKRSLASSSSHLLPNNNHSSTAPGSGGTNTMHPTPAVVFLVCPTWALPISQAKALRAQCDVVVKLHSFKDPAYALGEWGGGGSGGNPTLTHNPGWPMHPSPEFGTATGLLILRRLPRWGCVAPPSLPDTLTWLFTRGRRKLDISRPHPPPMKDDPAVSGEGSGGAPQNAGGLACASSGGGTAF